MKRNLVYFVTAVAGLLAAVPAFAQQASAVATPETVKWVAIASGFAMAIASAVCGYSQSKVAAAACEGLARNPGARPGIQIALILGLAFIETLALLTLVIVFAKVTTFPK